MFRTLAMIAGGLADEHGQRLVAEKFGYCHHCQARRQKAATAHAAANFAASATAVILWAAVSPAVGFALLAAAMILASDHSIVSRTPAPEWTAPAGISGSGMDAAAQ